MDKEVELKRKSESAITASAKYQKLNELEHVLKRPDMFVGSAVPQSDKLWYWDGEMKLGKITYVPALYKIFDEILVNAADNYLRGLKEKNPMATLKVEIDEKEGFIMVYNDGPGIPVEMHVTEKKPIPELIFGDLRAGENFDDTVERTWGGRNGYGAKLANIFSSTFNVDCCDGKNRFLQKFWNNMSNRSKPKITKSLKGRSYTKITFYPDFQKFGITKFTDDILHLFQRRVYDLAGTLHGCKVFLNKKKVPVSDFKKYVQLYKTVTEKNISVATKIIYCKVNERWEVAVHASEEFQQVSFVNNIHTSKGGVHVDYVADVLAKAVIEKVNTKGGYKLKPSQVKAHLAVYVNCIISNPKFDSQTKDSLTSKRSEWGSKCVFPPEFIKKLTSDPVGIVHLVEILSKTKEKVAQETALTGSKKVNVSVPKLDDANKAGTSEGKDCVLILTEGDSAKSLAIAGMSIVGRDYYGAFPLRGKLLNVRDATHEQIMKNEEIKNLLKIMGLSVGKKYDSVSQLRYGHIMIMTDQDYDGSHIKGLIINFIHHFWPSLIQLPGFLLEFVTPIVRAKKGKNTVSFYTIHEYEKWKETDDISKWTIKYYKGLATTEPEDAKSYFRALDRHRIKFHYTGEADDQAIVMAFHKKRADDRKNWLRALKPETFLDQNVQSVSYKDFVDKELILFSRDDCDRSIPAMMDGLKPSQRKILFACFKRNLKTDIRVAQLAGYVSEHTGYHHGEVSLHGAIVGLAQNFVGSNNVNLLYPSGMFGTRIMGGKDAGSARYIFTRLSEITRLIFRPEDDCLLTYMLDDGLPIEPVNYLPILPMVLVNGASGIGTGWSTNVPLYNPSDIVNNILGMMDNKPTPPLVPWCRGLKGNYVAGTTGWVSKYVFTQLSAKKFHFTDLPDCVWTDKFKEVLDKAVEAKTVVSYENQSTDTEVDFTVQFAAADVDPNKFFRVTHASTSNMHLFDTEGVITKYDSAEEILTSFYFHRIGYYDKRKAAMVATLKRELMKLESRVKFIQSVNNGSILISNRFRLDIEDALNSRGFPTESQVQKPVAKLQGEIENEKELKKPLFGYLLKMPLWSLTMERAKALELQHHIKMAELQALEILAPIDLWRRDLIEFIAKYEEMPKIEAETKPAVKRATKGKGSSSKRTKVAN